MRRLRISAISYLNTGDNGTTLNAFSTLPSAGAAYDARVRGMVAMVMTLQRSQEQ